MWSFVGHKGNPRWLWHAIDHHTGKVLAYVFGRRKDEVFLQLKALLEPFGLTRYYTDYWGAYTRHLDPDEHCPGKRNTQKIERKHLTLRTRIKRLVRKTICFSKTTQMHDIEKCFDRIDHADVLKKITTSPRLRRQVKGWLQAGVYEAGQWFPTEDGA